MPEPSNADSKRRGYAYNRTRQAFLASELRVADTHLTRLRGLMGSSRENFPPGTGLWIIPFHLFGYVMTLKDDRVFEILFVKSSKCPPRSRSLWGCHSYKV